MSTRRRQRLTAVQTTKIAGAIAYLIGWGYNAWYTHNWAPTPDAGVALALLVTGVVDLLFGDGTALDEAQVRAEAADIVLHHPSDDRAAVAAAVRRYKP